MQNMNYIINYLFNNINYNNTNETKISTFIITCDVEIKSRPKVCIRYSKCVIDLRYKKKKQVIDDEDEENKEENKKDEKITIEYGNDTTNKIIICFNVANHFDTIDIKKLESFIKNILVYKMVNYADSEQDKEKITEDIIDISNIKYKIIKTYSPEYGILKYQDSDTFYNVGSTYYFIRTDKNNFEVSCDRSYIMDCISVCLINDYDELKDIFINVRLSKVFSNPYFVGSLQSKIRKLLKEDFYENITDFEKDFYEFPIYENGEIKLHKIDLTMPDIVKPLFDIYKMYNKYINNE